MMKIENIKPRRDAGSGLWCSFLIPLAFLSRIYTTDESDIFIYFIISSALLLLQLGDVIQWAKSFHSQFQIVVAILTIIIINTLTSYDRGILLFAVPTSFFIFFWVFNTLLVKCPYSFSIGEAAIVSQAVSIFLFTFILTSWQSYETLERNGVIESTLFLQVLMVGCCIMIKLYHHFPQLRSPLKFIVTFIAVASITVVLWLMHLQRNPFTWLFYTCIVSRKRVYLILSMFLLVFVSVLFTTWCIANSYVQGSTVMRKFFHLVIMAIYVPGLLFDVEFMYLASGCTLSILIVLEIVRVVQLPFFAPAIENAFSIFIDEKDSGFLILTHIYLHIGCSCPLWLYPPKMGMHMNHWSGVVSVGLGDMIAAITGIGFGKHHWPGSKKTIEGTLCAIFAQLFALISILYLGHTFSIANILIIVFASVSTSLIEAKTSQVDNLILPLWMFSILSFIQQ